MTKTKTVRWPVCFVYVFISGLLHSALAQSSNLSQSALPSTSTDITRPVNLASVFNREGLVTDGTAFPNSGLDGANGFAYSATLLGSSLFYNGVNFSFGRTNQNNTVSAMGQSVPLPAGRFGFLLLLGTGVNGNQRGQIFTVSCTDGSTVNITQSLSDWGSPQSFSGETAVTSALYRDIFTGGKDNTTFNLYSYALPLDAGKIASKITLPNNSNVEILAMGLLNVTETTASPDEVLVVINNNSSTSRAIGTQYAQKRHITNILNIECIDSSLRQDNETIDFTAYLQEIETPLRSYLASHPQINYIVTTKGVPIRIDGASTGETFTGNTLTSLDSNLAALDYDKIPGATKIVFNDPNGSAVGTAWLNRYWNATIPFSHAVFGGYLVNRLDGYTLPDAESLATNALKAETGLKGGPILLDTEPDFGFADKTGEPAPIPGTLITQEDSFSTWNADMEHAADILSSRNISTDLDLSETFVGNRSNLSGYFSWGSNDDHFSQTAYNSLKFAPGAIGDTAVSTSARSFFRQSSGQTMIADLIAQGITGVKGYTDEPLLQGISSPTIALERYTRGFNLAESFYAASHFSGWTDVILGDPLSHPYPAQSATAAREP
jgi:uncharacterized protein (TIGR03790 family)